jgi:mono/diheme cytochrome c family protein
VRRGAPALGLLLALLPWQGVGAQGETRPQVSAEVYEGWRQYSVHCARCHGQDVLGNPVAANLLESAAPGGPMAEAGPFTAVVSGGRPDRGMPAFKDQMTPEQIAAVYAYVRGRAAKEVPAGRPRPPAG